MLEQLLSMTSGECRWIGSVDIHVYCWCPCDLVRMPTGRDGWLRRPPAFKVWTPDSVGSPWDREGWMDAPAAVRQIEALLAMEARHVA